MNWCQLDKTTTYVVVKDSTRLCWAESGETALLCLNGGVNWDKRRQSVEVFQSVTSVKGFKKGGEGREPVGSVENEGSAEGLDKRRRLESAALAERHTTARICGQLHQATTHLVDRLDKQIGDCHHASDRASIPRVSPDEDSRPRFLAFGSRCFLENDHLRLVVWQLGSFCAKQSLGDRVLTRRRDVGRVQAVWNDLPSVTPRLERTW